MTMTSNPKEAQISNLKPENLGDSSDTKQKMADALRILIKTKPFPKITVGDIVATCNINRNSFYYHFGKVIIWISRNFWNTSGQHFSIPWQLRFRQLGNEKPFHLHLNFQQNRRVILPCP